MEGEFIIVALITSTFGLIGLWMINHNWFKRQAIKYKYQLKRANISRKMKVPVKEDKTGFDTFKDILPILKGLDADQVGALADRVLGGDLEPTSGGGGGIGDLIIEYAEANPEAVKSFLEGLSGKKESKQEPPEFPTQ